LTAVANAAGQSRELCAVASLTRYRRLCRGNRMAWLACNAIRWVLTDDAIEQAELLWAIVVIRNDILITAYDRAPRVRFGTIYQRT
jgi:hypothetical protein